MDIAISRKYLRISTHCNFTSFLIKVKCCIFIFRQWTQKPQNWQYCFNIFYLLKSIHFQNTVAQSSVLPKLWSFSIIHQLNLFWSQLMWMLKMITILKKLRIVQLYSKSELTLMRPKFLMSTWLLKAGSDIR